MGCSDSFAAMLEDRDPDFRQRNDHNWAATEAERHNWTTLCAWGMSLFRGERVQFEPLKRITLPSGNRYLDEDRALSKLGWRGAETQEDHINRMADAGVDLQRWAEGTGSGGETAFAWLVEHWRADLKRTTADIDRHTAELKKLPHDSPKAAKRRKRNAEDIPRADELRRMIEWAKSKIV